MNKSLLCAGAAPNNEVGTSHCTKMDLDITTHSGLGNVAGGRYNFFVETKLHGGAMTQFRMQKR